MLGPRQLNDFSVQRHAVGSDGTTSGQTTGVMPAHIHAASKRAFEAPVSPGGMTRTACPNGIVIPAAGRLHLETPCSSVGRFAGRHISRLYALGTLVVTICRDHRRQPML